MTEAKLIDMKALHAGESLMIIQGCGWSQVACAPVMLAPSLKHLHVTMVVTIE